MKLFLFLLAGTAAMLLVMLICRRNVGIPLWRGVASMVLLTGIGVLSVKLMFYLENGTFNGLSFFGAVFFIPPLAYPIARLLRIGYADYLDVSAPSVSLMLSVMKINCILSDCCLGRVLYRNADGKAVRFPSRSVEMAAALLLALLLIVLIKKGICRHGMYPMFMCLYGASRFVLNLFRETEDFWLGMGIGNVWALLSVAAGVLWLLMIRRTTKKRNRSKRGKES